MKKRLSFYNWTSQWFNKIVYIDVSLDLINLILNLRVYKDIILS